MDWLDRMNGAMDYIESHLDKKIEFAKAAKVACCSVYHFQRMFSFITDVPLSEYIRRRRLTLAAFELRQTKSKVIDVALKYGYESSEAFSRAFKALHGVMPILARDEHTQLKAFPRMSFHISIKGEVEMNYRIEDKAAFTMAGLSFEISAVDNRQYNDLPKLWEELYQNGTLDRVHRDFGIPEDQCLHAGLYNFREGIFSYIIGVIADGIEIPDGYDLLKVPAFTWAIFPTGECTEENGTEMIHSVWKRIFPDWFPTSGYEHADGPEFEMYYSLGNGKYNQEVWIPVMKR